MEAKQHSRVQVKAKTRNHEDTRRTRRHFTGERSLNRPFARFTSGVRTGTTPHFALWMNNARAISALLRLKTIDLAENHPDAKTASAYACVFGGGVRNVFELSQMSEDQLLAIKGIGPAAVAHLRRDLKACNVFSMAF
jgi:uncharacterized protein YjiS (DUF1127 family)